MNEIPLTFVKGDNNDKSTPHAIVILSTTPDGEPLTSPLDLRGVISGFRVQKLMKEEIDDLDQYLQYHVTYETPEYHPEQCHYEMVEETIRDKLKPDVVSEDTGNQQINLVQVVADRASSTQNEVYFQRQVIEMLSIAK